MANIFSFILIVFFAAQQTNQIELHSLIIIHRHGDRTPLNTYPNDPYFSETYWPDGFGKLTNAGKQRMFKLGEYLRQRYSSFISNDPLEVFARSSDADRCIKSVQTLLTGLYPPKQRWIWNKEIKWQPIAIHSKPKDIDGMLHATAPCQRWNQVNQLVQQSTAYIEYFTRFKNFFEYLTEKSGTNITNLKLASLLNEILTEEVEAGLQMPDWVTKDTLRKLDEISAKNHFFETITRLQVRLRSGLLFDEVKKIMKQRKKKYIKLFIYSTHDIKLSAMLSGMRVFNGLNVPYSASIIFEIYGEQIENRTFKLFYLNDTETMEPHQLNLPACSGHEFCSVDLFIESHRDLFGLNWTRECSTLVHQSLLYNLIFSMILILSNVIELIAFIIVGVLMITIVISLLMIYLRRKKRSLQSKENSIQ